MSNFTFLKKEWSSLFSKMKKAEQRVKIEPTTAAHGCRLVMEECVFLMYDIEYLEYPYNTDLANLMAQEEFKAIIDARILSGMHIVRKTGNSASHYGNKVTSKDALISIKYLFTFLKWFAQNYSDDIPDLPGLFNEQLIPKVGAQALKRKQQQAARDLETAQLKAQIEAMKKAKEAAEAKAQESTEAFAALAEKQATEKAALQQQKVERRIEIPAEYTEAQTRVHLIDADLKEAGWHNLKKGRGLEYPVKGMPITSDNPKGNGFADYVLWDDNGKPLAVIEAKRTNKSVEVGKHQAFLYANCLEKMHGQRPVIFYTNGYETKIWEDDFYSTPRRVYGFYTKEELRLRIQRRNTRKDIRKATVDPIIAGRPYQMEAIQRVSEAFVTDGNTGLRGNKRNVLLVMATGSGKTRTAAALVEILLKHDWVKRVLFLADRNALVTQAKKRFGEFLPEVSAIDLTEEKENDTTRLVFSTYPTMLNKIDGLRNSDERFYGTGHFDLIIVDEAHRSVYNRYGAIFEYFDALIVGLTATPKNSIDHNTFELFGCSDADPTFSYELEEATPTYLNPYRNLDVSTKFLREGIKYADLTEKQKAQYEETFRDASTGLFPEEIKANAMNKWLFNTDTVNKVMDSLMSEGLKIEGGDKIGRTIIFAVNQKHADFIVDCFTKRYPDKPSGFITTIHNKISHSKSLIEAFCDEHKELNPQIAVSVDMMDTGIDAPRVLNLVFFKVVRSFAKFWQMIGRGTRLCPDVFGPDQPKDHFLIFDVCQNFEFFAVNKKGRDSVGSKPISQQIFESRLQLSRLLAETGDPENLELSKNLLDWLHGSIAKLDADRFQVKMAKRFVDEFEKRDRWNNLNADDVHLIEQHLSGLPVPESVKETTRRFDLMMLKLQIANLLELETEARFQNNLLNIAEVLSGKYTIPEVLRAKATIEQLKDPEFYKTLSQKRLEEIREEIRELVKYLDVKSTAPIYTNLQDSEVSMTVGEPLNTVGYGSIYKKRVESYIRENKNQMIISKLSGNQPITPAELKQLETILFDGGERGTKDDFVRTYGKQPLGRFVRSILGLSVEAANAAFADFLQVGNLRADQMTFLNKIISYLTKNGTIEKGMLFESPFTDSNDQGLVGVFDDADAGRIIQIIDEINENAGVA